MWRESGTRLAAVRRCAMAAAGQLPYFGRRSQVVWRRSGTASLPLAHATTQEIGVAACIAAIAPFHRGTEPAAELRIGLAYESGGRPRIVPVVVALPAEDTSIGAWFTQVIEAIAEAKRVYEGIPVDDIELLIGQPRGTGRRTLFSLLVTTLHGAPDRELLNDVTIRIGDDLCVAYDDRLLTRPVVEQWLHQVSAMITAVDDEHGSVYDVLANAVVSRWADRPVTGTAPSRDVIGMIMDVAASAPDDAALVAGDETVTYAHLVRRTQATAAWLADHQVSPGNIVGILAHPGTEFITTLLAIMYVGAVPAVLDAQSPPARLALAIVGAPMTMIIADAGRLDTAKVAVDNAGAGLRVVEMAVTGAAARPGHANAPYQVTSDAPGYVLFTSGSTGQPRPVLQTRRTLNAIAGWQIQRSGVGSKLRTLQRSALSFDVSLQEILSTLADGGCLYVLPDDIRHDLSQVAQFIATHSIERMFITPSGLQGILVSTETGLLKSLREIVCAGEPLIISGTTRLALREIGSRLDNQYGPTETHVCAAAEVRGDPFAWPDRPLIGAALPGTALRVVDSQLRPVPLGAPGELVVAGPTVALGYLSGDDGRFGSGPPDFGLPSSPWYRTGDVVREHPDGQMEFLGRADSQVKIRGYRVELGEIEAAAIGTGMVSDAVAFVIRHNNTTDRLGLAVSNTGAPVDKELLVSAMRQRLAGYMLPRPAEVVVAEAMPLTASGKLDRRRAVRWATGQVADRGHTGDGAVAARLRTLWLRTLGLDECDDQATFLALGGDSLAAVELAAALQDGFGISVSLRQILERMSLATLQQRSSRHRDDPAAAASTETSSDRTGSQAGHLPTVELPTFGQLSCILPSEATHIYLDVVVCSTYGQFGVLDTALSTVLDVGANIGLFAMHVLNRHPHARLVAVEPHPQAAQALRANLGSRADIVEKACAQHDGSGTLFAYPDMPAMSSLVPADGYDRDLMASLVNNDLARIGAPAQSITDHRPATPAARPVTVQLTRISQIVKEFNLAPLSLLKIDVQHGELAALEGVDDGDWQHIERVIVEVQDRGDAAAKVSALLENHGFIVAIHRDDLLHTNTDVAFVYAWAPAVHPNRTAAS